MVLNGEGVRKTNIESLDAELEIQEAALKIVTKEIPKSNLRSTFNLGPTFHPFSLQDIAGFLKVGPDISKRDKSVAWRLGHRPGPVGCWLVPHQPDPTSGETRPLKGRTIIAWTQCTHESFVSEIRNAIWVCLKMVSTPKPNGFHDHYPYYPY